MARCPQNLPSNIHGLMVETEAWVTSLRLPQEQSQDLNPEAAACPLHDALPHPCPRGIGLSAGKHSEVRRGA